MLAPTVNFSLNYISKLAAMKLRHLHTSGLLALVMATSVFSQEATIVEAPPPAKTAGGFAKPQSAIKGLLVMELGSGNYAGKASQMNCTAIAGPDATAQSTFRFNQKVGEDMTKALTEVIKHSVVKRGELPRGMRVDFAFEDKYGGKDGPSAAVACALMLDSLRTGEEIDGSFAVTGDLNADGSVQPVGGVPAKIRGAANRSCSYVAVPASAEKELIDSVLMEGPAALWEIQVFTVKTFEEARALSSTKKSAELTEAITKFAEVQKVLQAQKTPTLLANPKVQERLIAIQKAAPNCFSAKLMLAYGTGKLPKQLSLGGSLQKIDGITENLIKRMKDPKAEGVQPDMLAKAVSELAQIRTKLDTRTIAFADSIKDYGDVFRAIKANPPRSQNEADKVLGRLNNAASRIKMEEDKIRSNKAIMEEVMK